MREKCNCILGYELGYSHIDDGVWIEEVKKFWCRNRHNYNMLSHKTNFCPNCGKKIIVNKRGKLFDD